MPNYPMRFEIECQANSEKTSAWEITNQDRKTISCSIPKEFDGPGNAFSPEDLYLSAIANCYIATFKVIAANSKQSFESLNVSGELILDASEGRTAWMKTINLSISASGVANEERFLRLMERVSTQCMIINSVQTTVNFKFQASAES